MTQSSRSIDEYRLDEGSGALYHFFWDEFCDWFVEMAKPIFSAGSQVAKDETRETLGHVLESALRALHPFMPFITEELWQRLPRPESRPISIALAPYPTAEDGRHDAEAERQMAIVMGAISEARTVRSEHEIGRAQKLSIELRSADASVRELLIEHESFIEFLVNTEGPPKIGSPGGERPRGAVLTVAGDVEVLVNLRGLVEPKKEEERVQRLLKKTDKDIEVLKKRLANQNFVANAPPEVVAEARAQLAALERQRARLVEALALIPELS